jgi:hypothetical protein
MSFILSLFCWLLVIIAERTCSEKTIILQEESPISSFLAANPSLNHLQSSFHLFSAKEKSALNAYLYAQYHGYEYRQITTNYTYFNVELGFHSSWLKLFAIYECLLNDYDFVLYLDASYYYFDQPFIALLDQIELVWDQDHASEFYMVSDEEERVEIPSISVFPVHFNVQSHFFLFKNTETNRVVLKDWLLTDRTYGNEWKDHFPFELAPFHHFVANTFLEDNQLGILSVPSEKINEDEESYFLYKTKKVSPNRLDSLLIEQLESLQLILSEKEQEEQEQEENEEEERKGTSRSPPVVWTVSNFDFYLWTPSYWIVLNSTVLLSSLRSVVVNDSSGSGDCSSPSPLLHIDDDDGNNSLKPFVAHINEANLTAIFEDCLLSYRMIISNGLSCPNPNDDHEDDDEDDNQRQCREEEKEKKNDSQLEQFCSLVMEKLKEEEKVRRMEFHRARSLEWWKQRLKDDGRDSQLRRLYFLRNPEEEEKEKKEMQDKKITNNNGLGDPNTNNTNKNKNKNNSPSTPNTGTRRRVALPLFSSSADGSASPSLSLPLPVLPFKTIFTIFAGRADRLSVLFKYLFLALEQRIITEVHLWNYCRTREDELSLYQHYSGEEMEAKGIFIKKRSTNRKKWRDYYEYYDDYTASHPLDIIVKCDDDIVFLDLNQFPAFLRTVASSDCESDWKEEKNQKNENENETDSSSSSFNGLLFANVINNGVAAYYQQQLFGILPNHTTDTGTDIDHFEYPFQGLYGSLWESGAKATRLHEYFLSHSEQWLPLLLPRGARGSDSYRSNCYYYQPEILPIETRFSINFFAMKGCHWWKIREVGDDDEFHLTVSLPTVGRVMTNSLFSNFFVSHLSFAGQLKEMNESSLIEKYDEFFDYYRKNLFVVQ